MKVAYSVKDNIVSAIMYGLFLDIGRVTATDRSQIIDRCAVRRQRDRLRHEIIPDKVDFLVFTLMGKLIKHYRVTKMKSL